METQSRALREKGGTAKSQENKLRRSPHSLNPNTSKVSTSFFIPHTSGSSEGEISLNVSQLQTQSVRMGLGGALQPSEVYLIRQVSFLICRMSIKSDNVCRA